jgi:hypothetical protein
MATQAAKSPSAANRTPSGTTRPPIFRGVTALGCTIRKMSWPIVRKMIRTRITLIPSAVEPAHPPTNINMTSVILAAVSHRSKSAVTNSVVVMMLVTVNAESCNARSQEAPYSPSKTSTPHTKNTAATMIPKYASSSRSSTTS